MKKLCLFLFTLLIPLSLFSEVILHYNWGKVGNITYANAPEKMNPFKGSLILQSQGQPLFFADAPPLQRQSGDGAILFNGKSDGYIANQAVGSSQDNFVLEVWVKARSIDDNKNLHTVISNGTGKRGYLIGQKGDQWILVSGGVNVYSMSKVTIGEWVHLAVVAINSECNIWVNGVKGENFSRTTTLDPFFGVATSGVTDTYFNGEIYELRYSKLKDGEFDPKKSLLADFQMVEKAREKKNKARSVLAARVLEKGYQREIVKQYTASRPSGDWLIEKVNTPCKLIIDQHADESSFNLHLTNGLVDRTFYLADNIACVGYRNLSNGAEYLRAIKPEARLMIDSVWYNVGGLKGQKEFSYLLDSWLPDLESDQNSFTLVDISTEPTHKRYEWQPKYNSIVTPWPAKGLRVIMTYRPTEVMSQVDDVEVKVNYEIYEGLPLLAKWVEVASSKEHVIQQTECEVLAVTQDQVSRIHVESNFSFALVNAHPEGSALMHYAGEPKVYQAGRTTTEWRVDDEYHTWASHNQAEDIKLGFQHRNLLVSRLPLGPNTIVSPDKPFQSFITFELLHEKDDREHRTLGVRRFYKILAPQTTESLIAGGITSQNEQEIKGFIDQMSELKMERLDIMAWPGISHDNLKPEYVELWRNVAHYAKERGIVVGGYELQVASRGRGLEFDCVHPETGKVGSLFGQSVCIASKWKDEYYSRMWKFFDQTGLMTYNMDGPYHGDPCASTIHPHHSGLNDSQWEQWRTQTEVIAELQRRNMYVPIPDWYFLNGQCATGMGYREASANLTPEQQMLLGRQYIYDGTWYKLPTMGWMTLQLVGFYTNDPRVGLEPLNQNLDRYEMQLVQYLGSGCQMTIRGKRIYDTPETKIMVSKWLDWFRRYRTILTSDMLHIGRPTGRDLDMMLHVNPWNKEKAMALIFNPTGEEISKEITLPLYYAGFKNSAKVSIEGGKSNKFRLNALSECKLKVTIPAGKFTWVVIE